MLWLLVVTLFLHSRSQHELEVSTKQPIFVGSSVSDTIKTCIAMGNERAALRVKSEFKVFKWPRNMWTCSINNVLQTSDGPVSAQVPDKRWYWLKTCALATVGNWDALEKFSREKRPPGGEFVDMNSLHEKFSLY